MLRIEEYIMDDLDNEDLEKFTILKADEKSRMVYGWASVISKDGDAVIDTQGDVIEAQELVKATTDFMFDVRKAQAMHKPGVMGMVVHSFPLVEELAKSLGISCNKEGWIVGVKVTDDATWEKVKKGELKAFSIGAQARREKI